MVVGDDHDMRVALQHLAQRPRAGAGEAGAGRVLCAGCQQHGLRAVGQRALEGVGQHAGGVQRHALGAQAQRAQRIDAAEKARSLDRHRVARGEVGAQQALDGVDGAVGEIDLEGGRAVAGIPLACIGLQARVDRGFAVQARRAGASGHDGQRIGQAGGVGVAAGQVDQGRTGMRAVLLARLGRGADDGAAPALAERQAGADQPLVGGGHGIAIDPSVCASSRTGAAPGRAAGGAPAPAGARCRRSRPRWRR